jgi:hypothetical protein
MVWALKVSSGFGDYFPDGSHDESWDKQLREYTQSGLSEERRQSILRSRRSYRGWISAAFTHPPGTEFGGMVVPDPLPEELPSEYRTVKSYKSLASLIAMPNMLAVVDQDLKEIIEEMEPGVHRFWPIKIVMPRNKEYPANYYGILVGNFPNAFRPDASEPSAFRKGENIYLLGSFEKGKLEGLAFSEQAKGGMHLWREPNISQVDLFLSDQLLERIKKAGLRVGRHYRVRLVA